MTGRLTGIYKVLQFNEIRTGFCSLIPQRGYKFDADITWNPPKRVPCYDPSASGDLAPATLPSRATTRSKFQNSEELKTASEVVKKIFSLEYQPRHFIYKAYEKELVDKVKRHASDDFSEEVRIAKMTAKIRFHQPMVQEKPNKRKKMKVMVKELIEARKKCLKQLRAKDYRRFEWLLEKLEIVYRPHPEVFQTVTRKKSLVLLAKLQVEQQKEEKLSALKKSLDSQKVPFLEKKIEKLKWIKEMQEKYKLEPKVTDEQINECVERLEKVKIEVAERMKKGYTRKVHPYTLEVYDEESLREKEKAGVEIVEQMEKEEELREKAVES